MDNYISNDNWIKTVYAREDGQNLEHFLIPDIRTARIQWHSGEERYIIELDRDFAKNNKKKACNFLIINHELNEMMENYDIFTKISMIRDWYTLRSIPIPKHISVIISHIESIPEYQQLQYHRENGALQDVITPAYLHFLNTYFSEDGQSQLFRTLEEQFKNSFHNWIVNKRGIIFCRAYSLSNVHLHY